MVYVGNSQIENPHKICRPIENPGWSLENPQIKKNPQKVKIKFLDQKI